MTGPVPPRLALLLLRLVIPKTIREFVIGDLVEEFGRRVRSGDPDEATRWFWREARSVAREIGSYRDDSLPLTPPRPPMHGVLQDVQFALRLFVRRRVRDGHRDRDARAWHRRQHRDLQRHQAGFARGAAVPDR